MWRRTYLVLLVLRVYFALSPSYLHPDENFQGPEITSGSIFPYPTHRTWEWTSDHPIRSVFPIWLFYGVPMSLLKSIWTREEDGLVEPASIYYALRMVMFILSFVLEDWAIHELVHSPRRRKQVVLLVASSYVTWTYQTHTFSNAVETLLVLWCLVLIERIIKAEKRTSTASCFILGFLLVLGVFNRITFPAFILIPGLRLLPHFTKNPLSFLTIMLSGLLWTFVAVATDTAYYTGSEATRSFRALFSAMIHAPVLTIWNNLSYNTQTSNLAQHGLHPHYQHILINLPELLGPALLGLLWSMRMCVTSRLKTMLRNPRLTSAATGTMILSLIPHQEPRFLLPCIPLLLTCFQLPTTSLARRMFWTSWAFFNIAFSILMGVYHQGGVIPTQLAMPSYISQSLTAMKSTADNIEVYWWKTYPPPTYLLGTNHFNVQTAKPLNISTLPLMGLSKSLLHKKLSESVSSCESSDFLGKVSSKISSTISSSSSQQAEIYLVTPFAAWRLDDQFLTEQDYPPTSNFTFTWRQQHDTAATISTSRKSDDAGITKEEKEEQPHVELHLTHLGGYYKHLNLDDLDFGDDGVGPTLTRVIGRRGLGIWHVTRVCEVAQG